MEESSPEKVREKRLRGLASKRGLRLSQCLSPGTHVTSECAYTLNDERDERGSEGRMSLDEVEMYLSTIGTAEVWDDAATPCRHNQVMAIIEMTDGNLVAVHESVQQVKDRLDAADALAVFSGANGALAPINPAFVVDVRERVE
jgi:hypothetical protein